MIKKYGFGFLIVMLIFQLSYVAYSQSVLNSSITLLSTSFEDLSLSNPNIITPFLFTGESYGAIVYGYSLHPEFTNWKVDGNGRTGSIAINVIPNGNPDTDLATTATTSVSSAFLNSAFDVSGYNSVSLKFWVNSTSNPRLLVFIIVTVR